MTREHLTNVWLKVFLFTWCRYNNKHNRSNNIILLIEIEAHHHHTQQMELVVVLGVNLVIKLIKQAKQLWPTRRSLEVPRAEMNVY